MPPAKRSSKYCRNAAEKKRRVETKDLYSKLASLIPNKPSSSKVGQPVSVMLDQATSYVLQLRENVEELKRRKELMMIKGGDERESCTEDERESSVIPVFTIRDMGSILEVNLIAGLNNNNYFMLCKVFRVLEEEWVEVVKAGYSTVGDKIFCTIHSKPIYPRIGIDTSRVHERLNMLCR